MNCVGAGRKMVDDSSAGVASAAAIRTGAAETVCVLTPAWAVEQIEQECRAVFSLSGCEWTACTVPIANTSNTQSTAVVLTITLRSAHMRRMTPLWFGLLPILNLDDDLRTEDARKCSSPRLRGQARRCSYRPAGWSVGRDHGGNSLLQNVLLV